MKNGVREDWLITITTPKRVSDNDTPKRTWDYTEY